MYREMDNRKFEFEYLNLTVNLIWTSLNYCVNMLRGISICNKFELLSEHVKGDI